MAIPKGALKMDGVVPAMLVVNDPACPSTTVAVKVPRANPKILLLPWSLMNIIPALFHAIPTGLLHCVALSPPPVM